MENLDNLLLALFCFFMGAAVGGGGSLLALGFSHPPTCRLWQDT